MMRIEELVDMQQENTNEAANVLATCLSNHMISLRHNRTWHCDIEFVYKNGHYFIKRAA